MIFDISGLQNCVLVNKTEIENSSSNTNTYNFKANEGYEFTQNGVIITSPDSPDETEEVLTVEKGSTEFQVTKTYYSVSEMKINLIATEKKKSVSFPFVTNLENCVIDYSESTIQEGSHTFTITANEGHEFSKKGTYTLGDPDLPTPPATYEFFPSSKEVATLTINVNDMLTINLKATKKVESISNFTLLYKTNDSELGQLSVERFHNEEDGSLKDYGSNILKLYKLPFDVDIETIESKIQWGNVESSVMSKKLTKTRFTLDLGSIAIPEKYGNAFDYKNGEVEIFMPFIESITTDLKTVMNKTLHFSLIVNLYSGQCTVNIVSDREIVFSKDTNICLEIPFIQTTTGSNFNTLKTYLVNEIRKVKLIITRQLPKGTIFSSSDRLLGSDIHGYIEGDIVSSNYENMLTSDIYELQNKLRSGVKFK